MRYKNANSILPANLLEAVQSHVDGEYIYIPRKDENRKQWGEVKNSRKLLQERNDSIRFMYRNGISVREIAGQYYLSPKTIYKILADTDQDSLKK